MSKPKPCKTCGICPTCGRSASGFTYIPSPYWTWTYQYPPTIWSTTSVTNVTAASGSGNYTLTATN